YQDLEIYKVTNDVFTMVYDTNLVLSPAQFYDFKVAFDKVSGEIEVWVNNQIVARYTDPNPLQIGNAVSFRTGNALLQVSQIETYVGRTANTSLVLEVGPNSELPHENISPSNPAGLAKSIISDQVGNLGQAQLLLNVDFSEPIAPQNLSDMNLVDEDLIIGNPSNTYSAFWDQAIDVNSGIAEYFVVLNDPQSNSFVSVGSVLNYDFSGTFILDETYKFGIYAVNNAGLKSDTVYSDGFKWSLPNSLYEDEISLFKIYPNPSNGIISIKSDNYPIKIWVFDLMGRLVYQNEVKNGEQIDLGEKLANSQYLILLEREGNKEVQKLILKK
ncbi:MAG TPA: T9SS type A sorting domain-containing protein, partial [Bacteroidia bacterium]